jgi:taurine dioxygenase
MGSAAGYERIAVTPIAGALGAEIGGVDLTAALDNRTTDEIHRAFREHAVIFFRNQKLTPAGLKAFGRLFGPLGRVDFVKSVVREHPEVMVITREAEPPRPEVNFGNAWHSDMSYAEEPPLGTALHAQELPPVGGDTLWTNMYLAYETLSEGMRRLLDGLKAVHSAARAYGPQGAIVTNEEARGMVIRSGPEALIEREHPVVRRHPETGRKALFINPVYTLRFAGMSADESAPLLKFLFQHATRPEFTCRFRWSERALALWDNRCTMHFAINDYLGHRRVMHRITIAGDRPVAS